MTPTQIYNSTITLCRAIKRAIRVTGVPLTLQTARTVSTLACGEIFEITLTSFAKSSRAAFSILETYTRAGAKMEISKEDGETLTRGNSSGGGGHER